MHFLSLMEDIYKAEGKVGEGIGKGWSAMNTFKKCNILERIAFMKTNMLNESRLVKNIFFIL